MVHSGGMGHQSYDKHFFLPAKVLDTWFGTCKYSVTSFVTVSTRILGSLNVVAAILWSAQ